MIIDVFHNNHLESTEKITMLDDENKTKFINSMHTFFLKLCI